MYGLAYIFVTLFVTFFLIYLTLFPFCKVWKRLKHYHPGIWAAKGPFDIRTMAAHPNSISSFLEIIALADRDETLLKKDPELIKWCRFAREVWKMVPRSFVGQVIAFIGFVWFDLLFIHLIMGLFR